MSSGLFLTKSRLAGASLRFFYSITVRGGKYVYAVGLAEGKKSLVVAF